MGRHGCVRCVEFISTPKCSCLRDPRFPESLKSNLTWNPHRMLDTSFPRPQARRSVPRKHTCLWGTQHPLFAIAAQPPHLCSLYTKLETAGVGGRGHQASDVPSGTAGVYLKTRAFSLSLPPLTPSHPASSWQYHPQQPIIEL